MSTRSIWLLVFLFLVPAAVTRAKVPCKPLACPTPGTVAAARAIVERECPCVAQTSPRQYRRCAKRALRAAREEIGAALTAACLRDVRAAVNESTCGRTGTVACNKRNRRDTRTTCAIVSASKCAGSACGAFVSCADACNTAAQACAAPTTTSSTTTTTIGGSTTTTSSTPTTIIGGSTTTTSITTTTIGGGGNTTTSTTQPDSYSCSIATAACTADACSCGMNAGLDYHYGATGSVTGPVGTSLRVNTQPQQGGTIDCGGWTRVYGATITGCDVIGCCLHESGQPDTVTWTVYEAYDLPCICPPMSPGDANILIQCQLPPGPVEEHEQTTSPCP